MRTLYAGTIAACLALAGCSPLDQGHCYVLGSRAQGYLASGARRPDRDHSEILPATPRSQGEFAQAANKATAGSLIQRTTQTAGLPAACPCSSCDCLNVSVCRDGNCDGNYLIAFGATWCGPCQAMKPVYAELKERGYAVYSLDEAVHREAVKAARPRSYPCLIIYHDGAPVERIYGTSTVEYLEERLQ